MDCNRLSCSMRTTKHDNTAVLLGSDEKIRSNPGGQHHRRDRGYVKRPLFSGSALSLFPPRNSENLFFPPRNSLNLFRPPRNSEKRFFPPRNSENRRRRPPRNSENRLSADNVRSAVASAQSTSVRWVNDGNVAKARDRKNDPETK